MDNRCYEFIEGIKNLEYDQDSSVRETQNFKDFGFDLYYDPIEGIGLDYDKTATKLRRNKKNYPLIGALTSEKGIENFKSNDVIISINNLDLSKLEDDKILDLIYPNEINCFMK